MSQIHASSNGKPPVDFMSPATPSPFEHDGHLYPTAEHSFQAAKARHFKDSVRDGKSIIETPSPYAAKVLGYQVKDFDLDEGAWDKGKPVPPPIKIQHAYAANWYKFTRSKNNLALATELLTTGKRPLVYECISDFVWGNGPSYDMFGRRSPGQNLLGPILEKIRRKLIDAGISELLKKDAADAAAWRKDGDEGREGDS